VNAQAQNRDQLAAKMTRAQLAEAGAGMTLEVEVMHRRRRIRYFDIPRTGCLGSPPMLRMNIGQAGRWA
jgi:hypothetical protein